MILKAISSKKIRKYLEKNGTDPSKVENYINKLNGMEKIEYACDDKFTIILNGNRIGVSKRCTYAKMKDNNRLETGIAIAMSRL